MSKYQENQMISLVQQSIFQLSIPDININHLFIIKLTEVNKLLLKAQFFLIQIFVFTIFLTFSLISFNL